MKLKSIATWALGPTLAASLIGCGTNASSASTAFPTKPLNVVIAFNAGGTTDVQARALQPALEKALGQKLVFIYKTGAGGAIGFQYLAHAKADGYTLGGINTPHIFLQPLAHQGDFQWSDFRFIAESYNDPTVLAVRSDSSIRTLSDFVAACKDHPGKITVAGVGVMTGHYLASYMIQDQLGVTFQYVPFEGSAPEDAALLGGHVQVMIGNLSDVMRSRQSYRVLAIASEQRNAIDKTIPTFKELGYPVVTAIRRGFAVPKDTPDAVVQKLRAAFKQGLQDPAYVAKMKQIGAPIEYLDGPQFRQEIELEAKTSVAALEKFHAIESQAKH